MVMSDWLRDMVLNTTFDDSIESNITKLDNVYDVKTISSNMKIPVDSVLTNQKVIDSLSAVTQGGDAKLMSDTLEYSPEKVMQYEDESENVNIMAEEPEKQMHTIKALKWLYDKGSKVWSDFNWEDFKSGLKIGPASRYGIMTRSDTSPIEVAKQTLSPDRVNRNVKDDTRIQDLDSSLNAIADYQNEILSDTSAISTQDSSDLSGIPEMWLEPATELFDNNEQVDK
tara:strand:+ start:2320 stop:3000 length:681 start_codon:yes stop_codon:yes gene_type:complete